LQRTRKWIAIQRQKGIFEPVGGILVETRKMKDSGFKGMVFRGVAAVVVNLLYLRMKEGRRDEGLRTKQSINEFILTMAAHEAPLNKESS
jgi:hypothetical protein